MNKILIRYFMASHYWVPYHFHPILCTMSWQENNLSADISFLFYHFHHILCAVEQENDFSPDISFKLLIFYFVTFITFCALCGDKKTIFHQSSVTSFLFHHFHHILCAASWQENDLSPDISIKLLIMISLPSSHFVHCVVTRKRFVARH